ncbi:MAG: glycoside hydrolase family 16 protein [Flavipsychrobacter sp.]|nr:glycoside hydrolase family 16 protein [Flavipsychrobacter sp.]
MQGGVWSSSSPSIALVRDSATGVVEGINSGAATITYTVDGHTVTKPVTVNPTGNFPPGTNLCDTSAWLLVFYDEFNGFTDGPDHHPNALDLSKWYIEDGIPYGSEPLNVMKTSNCKVENGICTLSVHHGVFPYKDYSGSSGTASISSGHINTWQKFSYGKFEARIWYPAFDFAHGNFELNTRDYGPGYWHYAVDIAETYGRPYMGTGKGAYNQHTSRGFHRWIDNVPGYDGRETSWSYPHQTDLDKIWGTFLNLHESWHTFTFEWDKHFVKFSWDGGPPFVYGRESFRRGRKWVNNTDCLVSGVFRTDPAFPIDEPGLSDAFQIMLHCDVDRDIYSDTTQRLLGNMLIDYVRVWQRHPDHKHHDLCDRKILGPAAICDEGEYTYRITGAGAVTTGAMWHWSTSSNLTVTASGKDSVSVRRNTGLGPAWIKFADDNPECPVMEYLIRECR